MWIHQFAHEYSWVSNSKTQTTDTEVIEQALEEHAAGLYGQLLTHLRLETLSLTALSFFLRTFCKVAHNSRATAPLLLLEETSR